MNSVSLCLVFLLIDLFQGSSSNSVNIFTFIFLIILLQISVASTTPVGAENSADATILADIQVRSLATGDIDMSEMNDNKHDDKFNSVETEKSEAVALSSDDLNAVNAAKVQSWQTIQAAKELAEAQARAQKESQNDNE